MVIFNMMTGEYISDPISNESVKCLDWLYGKYEAAAKVRDLLDEGNCFRAKEHEVWELMEMLEQTQGIVPCLTVDSEINNLLYHLQMEVL